MKNYRLFIAIDLPKSIKDLIKSLKADLPTAKWVKEWHLTLKFIGNVNEETFLKTKAVLKTIKEKSFSLKITGVGCFERHGRTRVLWVGLENNQTLFNLQKQIETIISEEEICKPETRPFAAHITLARFNNVPVTKIQSYLDQYKELNTDPFEIKNFHLYSSELTQSGAIHTIEATYSLD